MHGAYDTRAVNSLRPRKAVQSGSCLIHSLRHPERTTFFKHLRASALRSSPTTGSPLAQVGLRSFEKLLSPTAMKIGVEGGVGCYAEKLPESERTLTVVPDQFRHESATAFNLRGRGLVLLTS